MEEGQDRKGLYAAYEHLSGSGTESEGEIEKKPSTAEKRTGPGFHTTMNTPTGHLWRHCIARDTHGTHITRT